MGKKWGNALGGYRTQKRASNGRFGSGRGQALRSAKKASRKKYRSEKKAARKKTATHSARQRAKISARVDHKDRKKAAIAVHDSSKGLSNRKKNLAKAAVVVGAVGVAYGGYLANEKRLDSKATAVLYHNTPAKVGVKVLTGKTHLKGSNYREHYKNTYHPILEAAENNRNNRLQSFADEVKANPQRWANLDDQKDVIDAIGKDYEKAIAKAPVVRNMGDPVFFSNKHRGIARKHYGGKGVFGMRSPVPSMTLKARYYGPIDSLQYDDWHFDNKPNHLVKSPSEVSGHKVREHAANSLNSRAPSANPRSRRTNTSPRKKSSENYFMIPEQTVKQNVKYSVASVKINKSASPVYSSAYIAAGLVARSGVRSKQEEAERKRRAAAARRAAKKAGKAPAKKAPAKKAPAKKAPAKKAAPKKAKKK